MAPKRETVEQYLDGTISFQGLKDQFGEELAEAVQSSIEQLEQGDVLPEEITE